MIRVRTTVLVLLVLLAVPFVAAQSALDESGPIRNRLDSIRQDLVELRFETALASIETLLGGPGLTEDERAETLVLSAQTHVALGDLDAAEGDYEKILKLRPAYQPAPSLTPQKAMDRYVKVRKRWVGDLRLRLDPLDLRLTVDGREVVVPTDGVLPLIAGQHFLRAEREGHDAEERPVDVVAGADTSIEIALLPNARDVVIRGEPVGAEVWLDGLPVGATVRPLGGIGEIGELTLSNVPLGEHAFELRLACHRTERLTETVAVDLMERSPQRLPLIRMVPEQSTLIVAGGVPGADLRIDGEFVGRMPVEHQRVCPGRRTVELRAGARVLWQSEESIAVNEERTITIRPRPNAVLVGATSWPRALSDFGARFNLLASLPLPVADLDSADGWAPLDFPRATDLVVAVVPSRREGAAERWYLYSPILRTSHRFDLAPEVSRPVWERTVWGVATADSTVGGPATVVALTPGGPAEIAGLSVGDRLVSLGGSGVNGSDDVARALAKGTAGTALTLEWVDPVGQRSQAELNGAWSPVLITARSSVEEAVVQAAWALVDAESDARQGPAALANLALLFSEYGHHDLAVDTWRRVRWGSRGGVGEGTTQYYLGCALEAAGHEDDAVEAYQKAARSASTTFDDEGPEVAPAARDRLADLGRSLN